MSSEYETAMEKWSVALKRRPEESHASLLSNRSAAWLALGWEAKSTGTTRRTAGLGLSNTCARPTAHTSILDPDIAADKIARRGRRPCEHGAVVGGFGQA